MPEAALNNSKPRGTIMLASGEFDKALIAFEIAAGQAAMGMDVTMWFALFGVNCIKKPRCRFSPRKWWPKSRGVNVGRNTCTDTPLQHLLVALNYDGSNHLPLSRLNFFGLGHWLLNRIMRAKGVASLEKLIQSAEQLGVKFKICQVCVDIMACDVMQDFVVTAEVSGVSGYALDTRSSQYNVVI